MSQLALMSISRLSDLLDAGETNDEQLTLLFLDRAEGVGRGLNCYITLCRETALAEARAATERAAAKQRRGKLDGIPVRSRTTSTSPAFPPATDLAALPGMFPMRIPRSFAACARPEP